MNDDAIGNSAFRSKILKDHLLRANEAALSFVKDLEPHLPEPVEPGSTLAKIQSKLLSSKILSAQVATSVESLRVVVNPALKLQKDKNTKDDGDLQQGHQQPNGKKPLRQSFKGDRESLADDSGWESGTVDMENGIADGASPESHDGSGRSSGVPSDFEAQAESESDEDANSSSDENGPVFRKSGGNHSSKKAISITESTFLPSLSVGFIQGSDDSDFDEAAEVNAADMPRKNRRGQRARRAYVCFIAFFHHGFMFIRIWEKKYGRHANHKKKEAEERAAAFAKKRENAQMLNAYNAQRRTLSSQESSNVCGPNLSRSKDDKPLHPSWEAKRKQKDKERGNIVPGQGKKIKF